MHSGSQNSESNEAFDALYRRERTPMLRVATLLLRSPAIAEEVVQEAFLTVSSRWDTLDNPGGYLRTTVVNGARMALRRHETERRLLARTPPPLPEQAPPDLVELHEALWKLPERQRAVLVLRYLLDLADADIGAALGCSSATVRSVAHRGLKAVRKELR